MTSNTEVIVQAGPLHWLWNQAKGFFRKLRGDKTESIIRPAVAHRDRFKVKVEDKGLAEDLVGRLFNGSLDHQQWTLEARQKIKETYIAQYMLAHGGRASMTPSDWGQIGSMLKRQYEFLRGFEQDLVDGKLSEAQAKYRLGMYFKSSSQAYERGKSEALGLPRNLVPAWPGDGSTVCRAQCGCEWVWEETEGDWLGTWTLGAREHCPDCLERAGKWNPYVIRKPPTPFSQV